MTDVTRILEDYKHARMTQDEAALALHSAYTADLGHTTLDLHRAQRVGAPEVVYAAGKTIEQVVDIFRMLAERGQNVLATRVTPAMAAAVQSSLVETVYHPVARTLSLVNSVPERAAHTIAVVTAGTSDAPVAEEAAVTAEFYGNPVLRISDVGVAGLHRVLARLPELQTARVVIVVAGMEGALPSVVGGLVRAPVLAVPTSVGYGASFGGLAALLGMLNTCTSGVSVVNIDNGFGAGYMASLINRS